MLNTYEKFVVYLDSDVLKYMYMTYTGQRSYPVMTKLLNILREGYHNDWIVTPLSMDHVVPFIEENKIEPDFLNMMGELGQMQFHQRFTIRTLQLIRIINHFFDNPYSKPQWRDAFSNDPEEKYYPGFNKYSAITPRIANRAVENERKNSQIYEFVDAYTEQKPLPDVAREHFQYIWSEFPELIVPHLPVQGKPEDHMKEFLNYEGLVDIPEFHIMSNILNTLIDTYGVDEVESGERDEQLFAAEIMGSYLPYCHFYVTTVDVAELVIMTGINEPYNVRVYDHNESSLYQMIHDIGERHQAKLRYQRQRKTKSVYQKGTR